MANYKTPGVYVEEISTLPASVAPVATAIPAFVGYTELRPTDKPVRITSLLEYREKFGVSRAENFQITLTVNATDPTVTDIAIADPAGGLSKYILYYQLQMYFRNGGGPCYIVSVDEYQEDGSFDKAKMLTAIGQLKEEDEPTILVVPEAVLLTNAADRAEINNALLDQCNKLQDRVAIMDVLANPANTVLQDAAAFRNNDVGMSYLKYGAAYYPRLKTTLVRYYDEDTLVITDNRGGAGSGAFHNFSLSILPLGEEYAMGKIVITNNANIDGDIFTIGTDTYTEGTDFTKGTSKNKTAAALAAAITAAGSAGYEVADQSGNTILIKATAKGAPGALPFTYNNNGTGDGATLSGTTLEIVAANTSLYNDIRKKLNSTYTLELYPGATMAGIYARVDRDRGVWKAPANVSVNGIYEPAVLVTPAQQADLNVDATSGKSINVIRPFAGKGTLVWGARTLAGNDNEWRYVPVRRFFNFMEESIKKATEPSVFEPNTQATWTRLKAMIENFLTQLWSAGALAGATPQQAFFVNVGLGKTMTALDILEGRLNIEVGVAAVRPAEFIILKFSHKLQES
ncbi:Phage tail sheath protein FI [Fulvivirga imtechensis AK7]|uniref:Phage tail sheath protein FI n=1 Tax=Fulvivirga imtechensis AK7 TaxID=1237149 RepID=L8JSX4_9BACT|nr:phage tail sheath C-terminal domain-containing protein [Fulvivirga imtechensis]ELR72076.1 Phage tail sheath protein FI [Fulvivirga imtechensis AK7]